MERFWSKVKKTKSCWYWNGAVSSGYGTIRGQDQKMIGAHRLSYILEYGRIPEGMQVLHECDNKLCVRPDHLFLGTQHDNMQDMIQKGRQARGKKLNHNCQVGESNHNSKLNEKLVKQIRKLHSEGISQAEISRKTGVHKANVWAVVNKISWKHVK